MTAAINPWLRHSACMMLVTGHCFPGYKSPVLLMSFACELHLLLVPGYVHVVFAISSAWLLFSCQDQSTVRVDSRLLSAASAHAYTPDIHDYTGSSHFL